MKSVAPAFMLTSCSCYSLTLKMEEICFSEMLVDFEQTARCSTPDDSTVQEKSSFKITCQSVVCAQTDDEARTARNSWDIDNVFQHSPLKPNN
jgi:hypothetical protein